MDARPVSVVLPFSRKPLKFKTKIFPIAKTHLAMQALAFDEFDARRDSQRLVVGFDGLIIAPERGQHVAAARRVPPPCSDPKI